MSFVAGRAGPGIGGGTATAARAENAGIGSGGVGAEDARSSWANEGPPIRVVVPGRSTGFAAAGVARFGFADLCAQPLGASDYLAIAQVYHTVVLSQVPVMDDDRRNDAKRFITLIDIFYEQHVKIVVSAEAPPTALYTGRTGREAFEFERTGSRLIEMQSREYLAAAHGSAAPRDAGDTGSLVET